MNIMNIPDSIVATVTVTIPRPNGYITATIAGTITGAIDADETACEYTTVTEIGGRVVVRNPDAPAGWVHELADGIRDVFPDATITVTER